MKVIFNSLIFELTALILAHVVRRSTCTGLAPPLDFGQIWYRVWSRNIRCTRNVQCQMSKVEVTAWKRL